MKEDEHELPVVKGLFGATIELQWPALSPDLNLIKNPWNTMKNNLQYEYGHVLKPTRDQLRAWIMEA